MSLFTPATIIWRGNSLVQLTSSAGPRSPSLPPPPQFLNPSQLSSHHPPSIIILVYSPPSRGYLTPPHPPAPTSTPHPARTAIHPILSTSRLFSSFLRVYLSYPSLSLWIKLYFFFLRSLLSTLSMSSFLSIYLYFPFFTSIPIYFPCSTLC